MNHNTQEVSSKIGISKAKKANNKIKKLKGGGEKKKGEKEKR